jgi:hypothetical protein
MFGHDDFVIRRATENGDARQRPLGNCWGKTVRCVP